MSRNFRTRFIATMAAISLCGAASVHAAVISATSNGYGLNANVSALALNLSLGPIPVGASGVSPAPYNLSQTTLNANVSSSIPFVITGNIGASVVNATATSNVDGTPGSKLATASGGVVGADLNVNTIPTLGGGVTLLGLDGTLSSTAQISGNTGTLVAAGTTTIENLALTLNAINVPLGAYVGVNVAPNTSVNLAALGILNASLILNEQIIAGDNSSITVNAFHLSVNIANAITTNVILGHSQVQMVTGPIPEPTSIVLGIGAALATVGWRPRRTR